MWTLTFGIVILSVVALAKEENKAEGDKKTTEKRGATSFTHIIRGGTGHSSIAAAHGGNPFHGVQIAYVPLAAYGHGYAAPSYAGYTRDIPLAVHQPYPVAIDKPVPYPIKIAYAVPVDRPYPIHIIKPYPIAVEKPVPYPVDNPVPYPVKVPVKVPVSQPVPYAVPKPYPVPTPVPYPVFVKAPHHGYDSNYMTPEYSSHPDDSFRGSYSSYSDSNSNSYNNGDNDGAYKNGYSGDGH